ncbi:MAG: GNAT family N-acetyltransferase [Clostridia bacterium]|nr:GNAT family N-acetyltransferase [Clostridia bacterium]
MDFIKLESERLWFREYRMEDFYVFYDMLSNIENIKYRSSEPKNEDDVHGYIEWGINCANQKPCINYRYAVVLKDTGETIGSCELAFTDKDPAELAWELHRYYWKQGYGTEIGQTLLRLGFDILGLRRIIADCNTLNIGSYKIMEKIGMRREAHYIKYCRGNSALNYEWCDKYLYAILQEEYFAMRKRSFQ